MKTLDGDATCGDAMKTRQYSGNHDDETTVALPNNIEKDIYSKSRNVIKKEYMLLAVRGNGVSGGEGEVNVVWPN